MAVPAVMHADGPTPSDAPVGIGALLLEFVIVALAFTVGYTVGARRASSSISFDHYTDRWQDTP
jgi:hypothetical protein